ncbi:DUF1003 domain-containing protein [Undibacterium sp. SXout11W]|uniref:DUF1003 domain-containing protein n=1 Tax=Undibacterium sp. SXout11W TaxID=3413050 RepID=UPI003BEF6BA1
MKKQTPATHDVLSDAVKNNIENIAKYYDREEEKISGPQSVIELISSFFGSTVYFCSFVMFVLSWICVNEFVLLVGYVPIDPPPFLWLQGMLGLNGVLIAIAVLTRQSRMTKIADIQVHLSLQVHLLTEQKVTKVLELLEALREDLPGVKNRVDPELTAMQVDTDLGAVLEAIEAKKVESKRL